MGRGLALRRPAFALLLTAALILVLDQATKAAVRGLILPGESLPVVPGVLWLTHVSNTGAAFSLLAGLRPLFIVNTLLVLGGIAFVWFRYKPQGRLVAVALGLIIGGAIGNFVDRLVAGRVTDFLDLRWWPVFNVADSAIVVGVAVMVFWLLFRQDDQDAGEGAGEG